MLLIILLGVLATCKKDEKVKSSSKEIRTFTVVGQVGDTKIDSANAKISIVMPFNAIISSLTPTITVSNKATVAPLSGVTNDFSKGAVAYTVTAENGTTKKWEVTISVAKRSDADILGFSIPNQFATTRYSNDSVFLVMPIGTSLSALVPTITVSPGASIKPTGGVVFDFSKGPISFVVTAADSSTTKKWTVLVTIAKSSAANIVSFSIPNQTSAAKISNDSIYLIMPLGTNFAALTPTITVSSGATISPAGGVATDFSKGLVTYTVTAADGTTQIKWYVSVTKVLSPSKMLSFTIPALSDTGTISSNAVSISVPSTTDWTKIIPNITVSPGAKITPASGTAVDFSTGKVTYTVTPADTTQPSTVYVVTLSVMHLFTYSNYASKYNLVGRFTNLTTVPRTWAPGSYITASFTGRYCDVVLNDQQIWGNSQNYIQIVVDDSLSMRVKTSGTSNITIRVSSTLPDKTHTITICKDTEAAIGYIEFVGLYCKQLVTPPTLQTHKIECIGNSITCGASSDASAVACGAGTWYDQHNAYMAYGPRTARALNAQYHLSSVSGIGLIHNCCTDTVQMPYVFGSTNLQLGGPAWDFTQYVPDVLTICLGQNDGAQPQATFCNAYVAFIQAIRVHYPNTQIVLLSSPMDNGTLSAQIKTYCTAVQNTMIALGDTKVSTYYFTKAWNSGCNTHPSVAQHAEIASELTTYIKSIMSW